MDATLQPGGFRMLSGPLAVPDDDIKEVLWKSLPYVRGEQPLWEQQVTGADWLGSKRAKIGASHLSTNRRGCQLAMPSKKPLAINVSE